MRRWLIMTCLCGVGCGGYASPAAPSGLLAVSAPIENGPRLSVSAVASTPHATHLTVTITGGQPDDPNLYCPTVTWIFGDGVGQTFAAQCVPYASGTLVRKSFGVDHVYAAAGTYTVTATVRTSALELKQSQIVVVD